MRDLKARLAGAAFAICFAGGASAATIYTIDASAIPFGVDDFSVQFLDADGDKHLTATEIVAGSFTGLPLLGGPADTIVDLPDIVIGPVTLKNSDVSSIATNWTGYFANCVGGAGSRQITTGRDVVV